MGFETILAKQWYEEYVRCEIGHLIPLLPFLCFTYLFLSKKHHLG